VGWTDTHCLIITPKNYTNAGRYVNCSKKPNCQVQFGLLDRKEEDDEEPHYEFALVIYSAKAIQPGEEITYDYGKSYFFQA
jgi:SET domain-containing protein